MDDPTHLAELLKGVASWNAWREAHPEILEPDLSGVDFMADTYKSHPLFIRDVGTSQPVISLYGGNLLGARLRYAILRGARLWESDLRKADLARANLQDASLWRADLQAANLRFANLRTADLGEADLRLSDLRGADLEDANVTGVKFSRGSRQRKFQGIRVATCYGNQIFKTFAQDQDYIETLRASGRWGAVKFWIWYITSDCGRSFVWWAGWSLFMAASFGLIYYFLLGPEHIKVDHLPFSLPTMIYYSVVTFTTLGFGDIKPITETAAMVVMVEVILGYIMLGGLIAIFANKVARRS